MGQQQSTLLDILPAELRSELMSFMLSLEVTVSIKNGIIGIGFRNGLFALNFTCDIQETYLDCISDFNYLVIESKDVSVCWGNRALPINAAGRIYVEIWLEQVMEFISDCVVNHAKIAEGDPSHRTHYHHTILGCTPAVYKQAMRGKYEACSMWHYPTLLRLRLAGWLPQFVTRSRCHRSDLVLFPHLIVRTALAAE